MLNISFFITAFSSIFWFYYSLRFIRIQDFAVSGGAEALFRTVVIVGLPIVAIWGIFAVVKNMYAGKQTEKYLLYLLDQLKKNAENTNALNCAMLAAEKEIKNGFILHEFDTLISDTNEILSDIIKRSNSISSAQMEHLWSRMAAGERWLIAKTFIETYNFQSGFAAHLLQKAQKDNLLKGSILEFQARIKSLYRLLEIHDTQKIFLNMIEYGAMGRVFNIISPIADKLNTAPVTAPETAVPEPAPRRTPTAQNDFSLTKEQEPAFPSFLSRPDASDTPSAFHRTSADINPQGEEDIRQHQINAGLKAVRDGLLTPEEGTNTALSTAPVSFSQTKAVLRNLKKEPTLTQNNEETSLSAPALKSRPEKKVVSPIKTASQRTEKKNKTEKIISLDELEKEIEASPDNNYDEYAYPFGAWLNDKEQK